MKEEIRTATSGEIAAEFRKMKVGEKVYFPLEIYNYNSLRTSPSTTLCRERIDGANWEVKLDLKNRRAIVTRTS